MRGLLSAWVVASPTYSVFLNIHILRGVERLWVGCFGGTLRSLAVSLPLLILLESVFGLLPLNMLTHQGISKPCERIQQKGIAMSEFPKLTPRQLRSAYCEIEEPFTEAENLIEALLLMSLGLFDYEAIAPQPHHGQIFHTVLHAAKAKLAEAERILHQHA